MSQKYETPQITDEEIKENCDGLNDCDSSILHFSEAVNNPDCPLQENKIKKLIMCYNKNHKGYEIGKQILERNGLMELLQNEEDMDDLTKAHEWLTGELEQGRNAVYGNDRLSFYENNNNRNPLLERPSEINIKHFNDINYLFGGRKRTRKVRKSGKSLRKMKRTTRKTHNKTRGSNKKKINKRNTRRKGGQWTDRLGINRFQLPQYKFLPDCNGTRPYIPNENWNERRDKISEKYLETYRDFNDTKKLLMDLQIIDRDVAVDLRHNCRLLSNYLIFWDKAKQKIIAWFKLGQQIKGQRRLLYYLIKMHDGEPLSLELQKIWDDVDKSRLSSDITVPVQNMTITDNYADEVSRMPSESSPDYINRISESPPLQATLVPSSSS